MDYFNDDRVNYFLHIGDAVYLAEYRGNDTWALFDESNCVKGLLLRETAEHDATSTYIRAVTRTGDTVATIAYLDIKDAIDEASRKLLDWAR